MTIGNVTFAVEEGIPTRWGRYVFTLTRNGVEIQRSKAYPSKFDAYMRGWLAALRLQNGA